MPYIPQKDRIRVVLQGATNAGELNYELTACVMRYVGKHPLKYQTLNDVVGALEGAKAEFQRRVLAPYEDAKIKANGDVYGPQ